MSKKIRTNMHAGGCECTYTYYMHKRKHVNRADSQVPGQIDWKAVGRRVREIRGFDTTQKHYALQLGVSQGQLSRYEKGSSEMSAEVLLRLARKSGKTIEWLLTGKNEI